MNPALYYLPYLHKYSLSSYLCGFYQSSWLIFPNKVPGPEFTKPSLFQGNHKIKDCFYSFLIPLFWYLLNIPPNKQAKFLSLNLKETYTKRKSLTFKEIS